MKVYTLATLYLCIRRQREPNIYRDYRVGIGGETKRLLRAWRLINPTRVMYFSAKNYPSADFSETRGIDWTLLGASNDIRGTRGSDGNMPN